jgi:hypothetical protein
MVRVIDIITHYLKLINVNNPRNVGVLLHTQTNLSSHIKQIINNYKPLEGGSKIPSKFDLYKPRKILEDEPQIKIVTVSYNNNNYKFEMSHDKDTIYYHLYNQDAKSDKSNILECIIIIVYKKDRSCLIQNILYDKSCIPRLELNNKGTTLLKIALKLINTIKDRYKIKVIELTDNSKKNCGGKEIKLSTMLTLLTGTTWYGKYGFYPKDIEYREYFIRNKKIMNNTLLSDILELKEMIIRAHKKSKSNLDIKQIISSYNYALDKKYKLKEFLTKFLLDYDLTCKIFFYFYHDLYTELKLKDLYGQTFIKDI